MKHRKEMIDTMILTLDCEATTYEKGNPFSHRNRLMSVAYQTNASTPIFLSIEHNGFPYQEALQVLRRLLGTCTMLVGFNIKYDLHWLRRYIPDCNLPSTIWDCQLGEFILDGQTHPYPSLDFACSKYGLPLKDDVVKTQYWDQGIDTADIPEEVLKKYNCLDVDLTYQVFKKQLPQFTGNLRNLFNLHCQDLLVLQEMEFNGLKYNSTFSREKGDQVAKEMEGVVARLTELVGELDINWNSTDHASAVLYGGKAKFTCREKTYRTLKDGTVKEGERWGVREVDFPRLIEPLDGSELAKPGVYSVAEDTLRNLKAHGKAKEIIRLILQTANLDKIKGTYYYGIPTLIDRMDWTPDTLHGTINQCVARTGRTSSSKPNVQNFDGRLKEMFYSRNPSDVTPC